MASDYLIRAVPAPVDVVGDGRSVVGLVAPYNSPADVSDGFGTYREQFAPGCFARPMRAPRAVKFMLQHEGSWVGRGEAAHDGPDGLRMTFRLDDTEAGRVAAYKISDQQASGLSVAYLPSRSRTEADGTITRVTVKALDHVALVAIGAYPEAKVEAIRSAPASVDRLSEWERWLEAHKC